MDTVVILSTALRVAFAAFGLVAVMAFSRILDKRLGLRFQEHIFPAILSDPRALGIYMAGRFIGICVMMGLAVSCLALVLVSAPASAGVFPTRYDRPIRQAAERYWPGIPWQLLKAQLYQESRLDPAARSPAGAEGLAQFMGPTWAEIATRIGYAGVDRRAAEPAIDGAAYYMMTLKRSFASTRELERHKIAAASYNAGIGNVSKAAARCGHDPSKRDTVQGVALTWASVAPCLPAVTGRHAAETTGYVERIWRWWAMMEAGR